MLNIFSKVIILQNMLGEGKELDEVEDIKKMVETLGDDGEHIKLAST